MEASTRRTAFPGRALLVLVLGALGSVRGPLGTVALLGPLAVVGSVATPVAEAVSFTLTERQRADAVRMGQRSVTSETFGGEWRVEGDPGESVTVVTPFHRLALAARHAAFKNEVFKPADQEKTLREVRDRLVFWVELRGRREDFARYYTARLHAGEREIVPAFVQNERTALRRDSQFVARCIYEFPTRDVPYEATVVLVVRDADGQPVTRFSVNLAKMR